MAEGKANNKRFIFTFKVHNPVGSLLPLLPTEKQIQYPVSQGKRSRGLPTAWSSTSLSGAY